MITDFNQQYNDALDGFATYRLREVTGERWGMRTRPVYRTSVLLWLYIRALNSYDPASLTNFMTEQQIRFILSQIKTLIGTNNGPAYS